MAAAHVGGAAAGAGRRQRPVQRGRLRGRTGARGEEAGSAGGGLGAPEDGGGRVRRGIGVEGGAETGGAVGQYCAERCGRGEVALADYVGCVLGKRDVWEGMCYSLAKIKEHIRFSSVEC